MGQIPFSVTGPAGAERVVFEQVDFHTLEVLGVRPILGRWFQPDEPTSVIVDPVNYCCIH